MRAHVDIDRAIVGMAHSLFDTLKFFQAGIYGKKVAIVAFVPVYGNETSSLAQQKFPEVSN